MKNIKLFRNVSFSIAMAAIVVTAALLSGCSTAQTDKFVAGLTNFNRGLAAVDETVKQVNATLYSNCTNLVTAASSINDIAGQCSKAAPYTSVANAVIDSYCQTPAVKEAGISASLSVTAKSVSAAKSTLAANKTACAAGG